MKGKSPLFTIGLIAAWYSSNIWVLLLNKYLLSNYGFKYPIFLTMCHMTACSLLSYIAIAGEIYGAERRMASLAKAYPKLLPLDLFKQVRKETLLEPSDLSIVDVKKTGLGNMWDFKI
ncbi:unnamed protein product [Prunus armeniaca]|uniref:Sugar phosphate transporter domain-containing protein n=1 Tax=Prunus armeniaca TaxID=36596 RepID=A0A6J5Y6U9_PRUAR|nr:unnamed protein product [Prunus armeniaca]